MGISCYEVNKRNLFKEKMVKLNNNFEKKDLIGIGSSSKVKWNIISNNIITNNRFGKSKKKPQINYMQWKKYQKSKHM